MTASKKGLFGWLVLALLVVLLDQGSKLVVLKNMAYGVNHAITPFFNLILVYNKGAAFSFLAQAGGWQRWLFTVLGVVAALYIVYLLQKHRGQTLFCLALALVLGGALGNVIDRIAYGHVIDFLDLYIRQYDWHVFNIFNIADCAISVGAVLLVLDELKRVRKTK